MVTLPEIVVIPTTLKVRVRLSGVKATLNRVAEKLEFVIHVLSDEDEMTRSLLMPDAWVIGRRAARRAIRKPRGDLVGRMLGEQ
ncbi:hypothetical protein KCU65_g401, partial [Aureobasidium melanogenum]